MKTEFKTLYKNTSLGQLQSWQIIVEGNTYYTIEGINQLSKSKPTVCVGKNIGRANETTPEEQAFEQAVWNSPSLISLPSLFALRIVACVI